MTFKDEDRYLWRLSSFKACAASATDGTLYSIAASRTSSSVISYMKSHFAIARCQQYTQSSSARQHTRLTWDCALLDGPTCAMDIERGPSYTLFTCDLARHGIVQTLASAPRIL